MLLIYEEEILKCDLINFSDLINLICKQLLIKPEESERFRICIMKLHEV